MMTSHKPPRLATALVRLIAGRNEPLIGDLEEQFRHGRSRRWYWSQVGAVALNRLVHDHRLQVVLAVAALLGTLATTGWWVTSRLAVPVALGFSFTSWKLWRLHRTSLAVLYVAAIALVLPNWMMGETLVQSGGDRVFWAIARVLAGYGVVGVLMVPFLILRLGRYGPLSEPPTSLSLSR